MFPGVTPQLSIKLLRRDDAIKFLQISYCLLEQACATKEKMFIFVNCTVVTSSWHHISSGLWTKFCFILIPIFHRPASAFRSLGDTTTPMNAEVERLNPLTVTFFIHLSSVLSLRRSCTHSYINQVATGQLRKKVGEKIPAPAGRNIALTFKF